MDQVADQAQNHHFSQYAPEKIPYAVDRYVRETNRLYRVLDRHLMNRRWIGDEYSIADMASYPWIVPWKRQRQNLDEFPNRKRWFAAIRGRPAVVAAYQRGEPWSGRPAVTEEGKKILFGQRAQKLFVHQSESTAHQEINMLKFYFNGSPNPTKIALFLEEAGLPYEPVLLIPAGVHNSPPSS